jgi:nucleotide-binding universal stress UspA family protein
MSSLRSILAGTDLSAASLDAVDRGYLLAEASQARYTVLHALGLDPVSSLRELFGENTEALTERIAGDAQRRLQRITANPSRNRGVVADAVVHPGLPGPALSTFAQQQDCDLLILGGRGAGAARRLIFGSTASRALRQSKIPVLIVKNKALDSYRRVLVAIDFSPVSQALIQFSRTIAPNAELTLLHVCTDAVEVQMRYASVTESVITDYRARTHRWASQQLRELAASCGLSPSQYTGQIAHGNPAGQILQHEEEHDPDLIVLGKHGTHVTEELLLGSVTKRALETTRSDVLVMVEGRQGRLV